MRRFFLLATAAMIAAGLPATMRAQARDVTGKVTESTTGLPLNDATVGLLGQQVGVRTNERGEYRLRVPAGDVTLLVRAIGFKRTTLRLAAGQSSANFTLEKDILQLEGVVVTGQATTIEKQNASTAIASVSAADIKNVPSASIEGNLAGKIVGAQIFENNGAPGGGMQVQIRGATSILGQGQPLYVIDGVIVSNDAISGGVDAVSHASGSVQSNQDQVVNRLADINPNDIESVEVLKSAAASAIYGSRATNGVVVITTKKGQAGQTRYNVTQRIGSQAMAKNLSSRKFSSYADVQPWTGGPKGDSAAKVLCVTTCPWYDYQAQLYGHHDPSFETLLSASGGINNTRFFASLADRQETGIELNTGARRTTARFNLDQTLGQKWTLSAGVDVTRNFDQRGLGNNNNAGVSPIYNFGYTPAIVNLGQKMANGHYPNDVMSGGGTGTSNVFEVLTYMINNEETWRSSGNLRLNYAAYSSARNSLQFTYLGGVDRFQQGGTVYSPNYLQFELADGFAGTAAQATALNYQFNENINAIWTYTPGWSWLNSAQTSTGGSYEVQAQNSYWIRSRGLLPTAQDVTNAQDVALVQNRVDFRDQSYYLNEQLLLLSEKLAINAGFRSDRSSADGNQTKFYTYPKYSASYRFVKPLSRWTNRIDEFKLRAAVGQSGNRPRYGDRDLLYAAGSLIGGNNGLVANGTVGNPTIKPETMHETEFGFDGAALDQRLAFEFTSYSRVIKDLLLTYPLPPSSGLTQQTINGGQMSTKGTEVSVTVVPIRRRDLEYSLRITYAKNTQMVDAMPVPTFNVLGSYGSSYGRNRIAVGVAPSKIWGNAPLRCPAGVVAGPLGNPTAGCAVADTILADATPRHQTQFLNQLTYKSWSISALFDWRNGGYTADMTNNLFDEGGNSRDYENASGNSAIPMLGAFRYTAFSKGDIRAYIQDGTYVKLRELNVSYQAPKRWADLAKARDMRLSLSGRNLFMWSKYWSYDPEFNNFGNTNFNRFIDLAPYPSVRSAFFSIDLGY